MCNPRSLTATGQYLRQPWLTSCTTTPIGYSSLATMKTAVILFVFALLVGVVLAGGQYGGYGGHGKGHGGHHGGYGRKHGGYGGHSGGYGHGGHKGGHHYGRHGRAVGRHYG
ncbi:uncharacterized protein LOC144178063 [Haemaphysalis longicornis]